MFIVSPLSQCTSTETRDRFLSYIEKIAPVTLEHERNCHGYAWFRSAGDNNEVPSHWLRGFEIYDSVEANQVEHRASHEYKTFRKAVGDEGLLARPSDLRFWRPTGIGFLVKEAQAHFYQRRSPEIMQYIVTDEFECKPEANSEVSSHLRSLATSAANDDSVLTFWVLDRGGNDESSVKENQSIYLFLRCKDKQASDAFYAQMGAREWKRIAELNVNRRKTTWVESGVGFLGR